MEKKCSTHNGIMLLQGGEPLIRENYVDTRKGIAIDGKWPLDL